MEYEVSVTYNNTSKIPNCLSVPHSTSLVPVSPRNRVSKCQQCEGGNLHVCVGYIKHLSWKINTLCCSCYRDCSKTTILRANCRRKFKPISAYFWARSDWVNAPFLLWMLFNIIQIHSSVLVSSFNTTEKTAMCSHLQTTQQQQRHFAGLQSD